MHDDRALLEKRITRELGERVFPRVHAARRALAIEAGPDRDHLAPFEVDTPWGPPWTTTWFRLTGAVPADWRGSRVEAVIDLGFTRAQAGFQAEGAVVAVRADGSTTPLQGIHPNRTCVAVEATPGPVELLVEAASNPALPPFRPSPMGSPDTAGDRPLYRFRRAELVLVDVDAEALVHDLDVLDGVMRSLPPTDPRRARLLTSIVEALDRVPDVAAARRALAPHLSEHPADPRADDPADLRLDHPDGRSVDHPVDSRADRRLPGRHRIVATGHAHIDTAWLWPMRETRRKCARTFASAVALMDEYPEYRFVCSQAQQYAWIEADHPDLFKSIVERVERGQWIPVGGMWVEADMNLPSAESIVRQIVFGQRYFEERFGRRCDEVWIPDVFGYPAGLPQLFAAGGMRRFVTQKLSWNKQNRFPHHTFWWEGLDGTRVLTHFPPVDTYNAEITPAEIAHSVANFREHRWSTASLMPFGYGDGGGGPTREMLERARRLADSDPTTTLEVGGPGDFFAHVEREIARGAPVPVWRGELYFETHRGTLTSQLRTKLGNRRCERLLVEAELWAASLGRSADVDDLWRAVLTQQFHDILPGSSIAWVHDDAEAAFARVQDALEERIASSLAELCPIGRHVANPADAPLRGVVVLPVTEGVEPARSAQRLADGALAVTVDVPPLGTAPFDPGAVPAGDRVVVTDTSMVNRHLAVRWDDAGTLVSIIDLASKREIVPSEQAAAVLELARDQPVEYDAWDLERWTREGAVPMRSANPSDGAVEVEVIDRGPLVGRVRVSRTFGPSSAALVYELRADDRRLLIHVELDWQHDEHLLSIAFPLDVRADVASCDVQLGVVARPTHPSSPWDAAKFEVCAHRFVDLSEPSFGVAVLNDGRYGHDVFDGAVRVSLARAARYPDPDADRGRHAVTLAIVPHDGDLAAVRAAASLLNSPPRLVEGRSHLDDAAANALRSPVVELVAGDGEARGIEVDAVKLADDDSGDLIVRLHEACGDRTSFTVRAGERIESAQRTNLLEEPIAGEEVGDGVVAVTLRPFELVTLRLRLAGTS